MRIEADSPALATRGFLTQLAPHKTDMKSVHAQKALHNTQITNNRTGILHPLPLNVKAVAK